MESKTRETVRSTPSRHEKSLGLLTMKFVSLLQEAENGVLDLKVAADSLAVKQKRRIYDITNVLEGVGLIEKKNKNIIQWRGQNTSSQTQDIQEQVRVLKAHISELKAQEKALDDQKARLEENIKHLRHDPITNAYKFVTHEDICSAFSGDTLLAVVAPAGTQVEVPIPEMGKSGEWKYQVNLRSNSAPIQVLLISRDSSSIVPVVFPVPPTGEICVMPSSPSTPPSLQRLPLMMTACTASSATSLCCSQDLICSDHMMVLVDHEDMLTPSSTPEESQMECHSQSSESLEQSQLDLADSEFHSYLVDGSMLKLSTAEELVKEDRDGAVDLMDVLMSVDDKDYSFNLDVTEGMCDLFDVQVLNY
ncbi:transcription factor E2F5 [Cololabis saira]|uniref:transcription factor E2F5 n=1 Tax=Cololabis saira TaxID=129043 RepID=UPI002AD2E4E0|nr:transcription factor E2F5 [Cololabis saira]